MALRRALTRLNLKDTTACDRITICMACGERCGVRYIVPNGDMPPWVVCMTCYREHEDACSEDVDDEVAQ
jgi:hypothetical protein